MNKPTFDDMATLSRDDLRTVRRQINDDTVKRALSGASGEVTEAFRMTMAEVIWRRWLGEIEARGPVPEDEVAAARLEIVDAALDLVTAGDILVPTPAEEKEEEERLGEILAEIRRLREEEDGAGGQVTMIVDGLRVRCFAADGNDDEEDAEEDFAAKWEQAKAAGTATTLADVIRTQWDEMAAASNEEPAERPADGGGDAPKRAWWEDILTEDVIKEMFNRDADAHGWPEGPERDALEVQFRELIDLIKSEAPPPRVIQYTRWVRDSDEPEDLVNREGPPANGDRDGGEEKEE